MHPGHRIYQQYGKLKREKKENGEHSDVQAWVALLRIDVSQVAYLRSDHHIYQGRRKAIRGIREKGEHSNVHRPKQYRQIRITYREKKKPTPDIEHRQQQPPWIIYDSLQRKLQEVRRLVELGMSQGLAFIYRNSEP